MTTYAEIMQFAAASAAEAESTIKGAILGALVDLWLGDYRAHTPEAEIVEVVTGDFRNLFDLKEERLIAAYGFIAGPTAHRRDASRMRGFPRPPAGYVKGHAVAHQFGGGLDINLVPQSGVMNSGAFRVLEREALRHIGCLYFSNWIYDGPAGAQVPSAVVQGLIRPRDSRDPEGAPTSGSGHLIFRIIQHAN